MYIYDLIKKYNFFIKCTRGVQNRSTILKKLFLIKCQEKNHINYIMIKISEVRFHEVQYPIGKKD